MRLLVSAGEPSGDQRAAEVLAELGLMTGVEAFGLGGGKLAETGMDVTMHMSGYAVMGFTEILASIPRFLALEAEMTAMAVERKADAALLVDYPGFNMRLGRRLRKAGIPVIQYVAPQMWAWGSWRTGKLRKSCDLLLTLFPFEVEFFRRRGINAVFTGHPLKGRISGNQTTGELLGLLPGSRAQEVRHLLGPMVEAYTILRERGLVRGGILGVSDHLPPETYSIAEGIPGLVMKQGSREVLQQSRAALVCSGTATLETALHGVPFVVCYRTGTLTYALARLLVRGVKRIGMASIVAGTEVAPELIQGRVTPVRMAEKASSLLVSGREREEAVKKLSLVREALGEGNPAAKAATEILRFTGEAQ